MGGRGYQDGVWKTQFFCVFFGPENSHDKSYQCQIIFFLFWGVTLYNVKPNNNTRTPALYEIKHPYNVSSKVDEISIQHIMWLAAVMIRVVLLYLWHPRRQTWALLDILPSLVHGYLKIIHQSWLKTFHNHNLLFPLRYEQYLNKCTKKKW